MLAPSTTDLAILRAEVRRAAAHAWSAMLDRFHAPVLEHMARDREQQAREHRHAHLDAQALHRHISRLEPRMSEPPQQTVQAKPTVGRIVHYQLSGSDAEQINRRRADAEKNRPQIQADATGYVAHVGNKAEAGQVLPMVVVRVWSETTVNGQVLLDGNDTFWRSSATLADEPADGRWNWPPRA